MSNAALHNKPFILLPAYYYGKKKSKRVGRPPGGHSNLEGGVKRRGRRRKRRKQLFVHKKRRSSASVDNTPAGSPQVTNIFLIKLYTKQRFTGIVKSTLFTLIPPWTKLEFANSLFICLFLPLAHRVVERKRIWMKTTPWVKTLVRSCRMISWMILSNRLGSPSPPRHLPLHQPHPGPRVDDGNLAHPHFLMMRIALLHQR